MGISELKGQSIYLDANIFIYLLEGYSEFISILTQIFDLIDRGTIRAVTSELTLAEVLVKPLMDSNSTLEKVYSSTIQTTEALFVAPISRDILLKAANLRAELRGFRLPDAIHAATANATNCKAFLTNDKRFKNLYDIRTIILSEIKDTLFSL